MRTLEEPADGRRRPRSRKPLGVTPVGVRSSPPPPSAVSSVWSELLPLKEKVARSNRARRTNMRHVRWMRLSAS
jgi:hypothetical protein